MTSLDTDERLWGETPEWLWIWLHPNAFIRGASPAQPWQRLEIRLRRASQRLPYHMSQKLVEAAHKYRHQGGIEVTTFPGVVRTVVREDGYEGPNLAETVIKDDAEWRRRTGFGRGLPDVDPATVRAVTSEPGDPNHPVWTYPLGADYTGPVGARPAQLQATAPVRTHLDEPTIGDDPAGGALQAVASLARDIDKDLYLGTFPSGSATTTDFTNSWQGTIRVLRALAEQVKQRDKFAADLERVNGELAKSEAGRKAAEARPDTQFIVQDLQRKLTDSEARCSSACRTVNELRAELGKERDRADRADGSAGNPSGAGAKHRNDSVALLLGAGCNTTQAHNLTDAAIHQMLAALRRWEHERPESDGEDDRDRIEVLEATLASIATTVDSVTAHAEAIEACHELGIDLTDD